MLRCRVRGLRPGTRKLRRIITERDERSTKIHLAWAQDYRVAAEWLRWRWHARAKRKLAQSISGSGCLTVLSTSCRRFFAARGQPVGQRSLATPHRPPPRPRIHPPPPRPAEEADEGLRKERR